MPRFLLLTSRKPTFVAACLPDHFAYLDRLRRAGHLELAGGFTDRTGGAYAVIAASLAEAEAIAAADPLATSGSSGIAVKEWLAKTERYVGAYGVLVHEGRALLIKKGRGPYTGTLDLPGGGLEYAEAPADAVVREFAEETGLTVRVTGLLPPFSHTSEEPRHHLGFFFTVEPVGAAPLRTGADGQDSLGAVWVPVAELGQQNLSPLARQAFGL